MGKIVVGCLDMVSGEVSKCKECNSRNKPIACAGYRHKCDIELLLEEEREVKP